jgi:hypothetical protein
MRAGMSSSDADIARQRWTPLGEGVRDVLSGEEAQEGLRCGQGKRCIGPRRRAGESRERPHIAASPLPLVATKIELDPILGWAKNEFGTDPSLV